MGFDLEISVPALTVFIQGVLSFFSPCVLPLVPLYVGYLAGGARKVEEDGTIRYPRGRVMGNTLFFVLGISAAFFLLGFGFTALGQFFRDNRLWFARVSGALMVLLGLYQLGVFGRSAALERERRLPFRLDGRTMGPLMALVLGFTFSFAWTPCVGPVLGSVLLMASSSASAPAAALLIGVYTLGFVLPFLAVGLFTGGVLSFFKRHQQVVRWTGKAGAVLLILMGMMTFTGVMDGLSAGLAQAGTGTEAVQSQEDGGGEGASAPEEPAGEAGPPAVPAPDFTLADQYGEEHSLSDYRGKTIFLNFWATWCGPCQGEMPDIQALYEEYGGNREDLVVLGVAAPGLGREGTREDIAAFLEEKGYTFPTVMDAEYQLTYQYGIRAYPTTWMIDGEGSLYGYVEGAMTGEIMRDIVEQTMEAQR